MPLDMNYVRNAAEQIQKEQSEGSNGRRDISNYTYKAGQNRGRLLSPWPGSGELAMHVWHHFALPAPHKHAFCYENMFPGRGIQCPLCQKLREIKARGIECWRQSAVDIPRTNWIDRMPVNGFNQPVGWDQHPGVQLIDLKVNIFNYFIGMVAQSNIDLTSTEAGYDVMIIESDGKHKDPAIFPGAPSALAPTPELGALWLSQMYDLRKIVKIPDWASPEGKKTWEKLCQAATELERSYLSGSGAVAPGAPPVGQWPATAPAGQAQPYFTQPSAPAPGQPTAPPPQAPPPQYSNPGAMGAPGDVPFGAPPAAPPPAPAPAYRDPSKVYDVHGNEITQPGYKPPAAPAQQPPVAAPPQMPPPPPAYQPPPAPPQQQFTPPPAPPQMPSPPQAAPPQQQQFTPPPSMPTVPAPSSSTPQNDLPPWDGKPAQSAPPPPPPQQQQAPAPPPAAPVMTATSADGKPICFSQSRSNLSVVYGANGQSPISGGWSDKPEEVGYRCTMCPHDLECGSKARATYPGDYVKDTNGNYPPR